MPRVIVYYAHPGHRHSVANRAMQAALDGIDGLTRVDLYSEYPRHDINIQQEQQRLLEHDTVVFQFPMLWYSTPSIIKEWQDLVLEYGFAYGRDGTKLAGKSLLLCITTGAEKSDYSPEGRHGTSIRSLLLPFEKTALLCHMQFLSPMVLYGALGLRDEGQQALLDQHADAYKQLVSALQSGEIAPDQLMGNDVLTAESCQELSQ